MNWFIMGWTMENNEQLQWMNSLTDKQLTVFLNKVLENRRRSDGEEEVSFFIGYGHRYKETPWSLSVVCSHDPEHYPDNMLMLDDLPVSQHGECQSCGQGTISYLKHALCAVCGMSVYGT